MAVRQLSLSLGFLPPLVAEKNLWVQVAEIFYGRLRCCQSTVSSTEQKILWGRGTGPLTPLSDVSTIQHYYHRLLRPVSTGKNDHLQ